MSLFQSDVVFRTILDLALEDMKQNPYVIEHIFSSLTENPYLKTVYGAKEVQNAKDFLLSNKIGIFHKHRMDSVQFPCITLAIGTSIESLQHSTLGNLSTEYYDYSPDEINKPIQWISPPQNVLSYDPITGLVEVEPSETYKYVDYQQLATDPESGDAYSIISKGGVNGFFIDKNLDFQYTKLGVAPRYMVYRSRLERIVSKETVEIGVHSTSPETALYLFYFAKYAILRYREGLLETNNFNLSSITCTDLHKNTGFGADKIYSRYITLSGLVEEKWLKTPSRIVEAIDLIDNYTTDVNGNITEVSEAGIKFMSNEDTVDSSPENDNKIWKTIK